jgi:uncharacterized membrane protein
MAVFLSLLTAACYGTGDFCGGLAAKKARVVQVVALSHTVGLVGVAIVTPFLADAFLWRDMGLGAVGGLFGGVAVALLYRRLAVGPMSVVAPLTAVTSAAVPAIWGVVTGDSLGPWAWVGVIMALVAITLVSMVRDGSTATVTPLVVGESLLSGVGFGAFFIFLDATDSSTAPWPIVASRVLTSVVLVTVLIAGREPALPTEASTLRLIALVGLFDTGSNITFLYATNEGMLTLVAVLSSLYPIGTVLLARLILSERMTKPQLSGFVIAMAATVLIAAG